MVVLNVTEIWECLSQSWLRHRFVNRVIECVSGTCSNVLGPRGGLEKPAIGLVWSAGEGSEYQKRSGGTLKVHEDKPGSSLSPASTWLVLPFYIPPLFPGPGSEGSPTMSCAFKQQRVSFVNHHILLVSMTKTIMPMHLSVRTEIRLTGNFNRWDCSRLIHLCGCQLSALHVDKDNVWRSLIT